MKTKSSLAALFAAIALFSAGAALVPLALADHHEPKKAAPTTTVAGKLEPVTDKDAAWATQARKAYPLDVCVVAGGKLGSMGVPPQYAYRVPGQPDRLVVFCCSGCEDDFMKEPANYLSKIDVAAKAKK
jgi:hypothetical protein